jgi:putative transposase
VRAKLTLAERQFHCESCGARLDRDYNAALNLAALADRVVLGELRPDAKQPAGNPGKTTIGGIGYRHGKTPGPAGSQRHPREAVAR